MKVAIITHHFPPTFNAGGEQYAYRIAKMLMKLDHEVEVVCIESITDGSLTPVCKTTVFDGITVHRLYFNLNHSSNEFELRFRNPYLGEWVNQFLVRFDPDVVHF